MDKQSTGKGFTQGNFRMSQPSITKASSVLIHAWYMSLTYNLRVNVSKKHTLFFLILSERSRHDWKQILK